MIKNGLILILTLMSSTLFAQQTSDLYEKIINVMQTELNYTYDSTSNKPKVHKPDTTSIDKGRLQHYSSLPENPSPLVIKDGLAIKIEDLNKYNLANIENIEVMKSDDPKTAVFYGFRGSVKGVILISSIKTD